MSRQNHQLDPRDRSRFHPCVLVLGSLTLVGIGLGACGSAPDTVAQPIPETERQEAVGDDYHGTWIPDPYRWLEDQDGAKTAAWTTLQNGATEAYLDAVSARERLRQRLTELWNYPRVSAPGKAGESWYFSKNDGLQAQSVIYKANSPTGTGSVFLDPNTFSKDGTVSLAGMSFSKDGHYAAYAISRSGSDWREWRVVDTQTGELLPDHIRWTKFTTATWLPDGSGFLYSRFKEPEEGKAYESANRLATYCLHKLRTQQKDDVVVYSDPDHPERRAGAQLSDDGKFFVFTISSGTDARNRVSVLDVDRIGQKPKPVFTELTASYRFLGNDGRVAYFLTDDGAPRRRIITVNVDNPQKDVIKSEEDGSAETTQQPIKEVAKDSKELEDQQQAEKDKKAGKTKPVVKDWKTLIAQTTDTLESARIVGERFILTYLRNAHNVVVTSKLDGTNVSPLSLPGLGSASGFNGKRTDELSFFSFQTFTTPPSIYLLNPKTGDVSLHHQPKLAYTPDDFVTRQVAFQSADGTRVPMFLVHKKGIPLNGDNPTYLYGYGGFNISLKPRFRANLIAWLELGGVYAQPTLRGGGEFGRDWHEAGMLEKKQNVFDDFISAARYLVRNDYTRRERLAIGGGSNGGLLVGATLTQAPNMFGAAIPEVGVLDMLRYHKFTIGHAWIPEYGSSDDRKQFAVLRGYSPLHNVQAGTPYPPTMIMTGDHDDRVLPGHSYKFAATLQRAQSGGAPILLRVARNSGHGSGKPVAMRIAEAADRWAFLVGALGMD